MISELARCLRSAGLDVTIEELKDIIWLAERLPAPSINRSRGSKPDNNDENFEEYKGRSGDDEKPAFKVRDPQPALDRASKKDDSEPTSLYPAKQRGSICASTLRVPGVASTDHPEELRRALQPFSRRVPSRWRTSLDEDETASRAADTGVWLPLYRPVRERWFDLILVVESSPSVAVWAETLAEFERLLRNQSAFRSVVVYRMNDFHGDEITSADGRTSYPIGHLVNRTPQQLILLVTDTTSVSWRSGVAQTLLYKLAASTSVSILQLLPRRAWRHTVVGDPELMLFAERPGEVNARLKAIRPWWLDESDVKEALGVPVIGLDATTIRKWAGTMTARGSASVPGVLVAKPSSTKPEVTHSVDAKVIPPEVSGTARVARYRSMVSRSAYELAVFLSVPDPLTLPVMRLVQRAMLPDTGTAELAEFFVGGLLQRTAIIDALETQPREETYRLDEDVRNELLKSLRYSEEGKINAQLRSVGKYLLEEGDAANSFPVYFPSTTGHHRLADWALPFANVSREVLRTHMGGESAQDTDVSPKVLPEHMVRASVGQTVPKTIVFCSDGTWNELDEDVDGNAPDTTSGLQPGSTNVFKAFAWLEGDIQPNDYWGSTEMEKVLTSENGVPVQVAKYVHGVGDPAKLPNSAVGGGFGGGLVARIARGYTYISRNYVPGDSIVIIGFSRGAYTARALAGLIAEQGLMRPDLAAIDDNDRYDTATAAWYRWKQSRNTTFQKIADGLTQFLELHKAFPNPKKLDDSCFVPADIAAVAVWDTVGALGIPVYHMGTAIDLFRFSDNALSPKIRLGIHAVSIDEQRRQFVPTLWDENDARVIQALFAGDHCDVGGGYPDHGLSDGPLLWVVNRLMQSDIGVRFMDNPPCLVKPDPLAPRHRPWVDDPIWLASGIASRSFPSAIQVDASVHLRIARLPEALSGDPGNTVAYHPSNLPESIDAQANSIPISQPSPVVSPPKS